jgi:PAS domain S-box-containing protein
MSTPTRILIVENLPTDAELAIREIRKSIPEAIFQHVQTESAYLEALETYSPDLILSEYRMPQFTGMRAIKLAKERVPLTPVIIYTGSKNEDVAVECMKAGAANYVIKENLKRLGSAVIHALEEKQLHIEQKLAEGKLRDSETKLRKAQHFAHIGSWTWNVKTNQLDWSDEMYNIFGLAKETFTGVLSDVVAQAIHPHDRAKVDASNQSVIDEGKPIPLEYRIIWSDGSVHVVWAEAGEIILDDEGAPYLLSGTVQEITERKRAEEALRESEEKYRMLFREMLDGFALHEIICDAQGNPIDYRYIAANRAFEQLTGLKAQDIVGKTVLEVLPGTERYWIETYGKVALSGEPTFFENYSAELNKHFQITAFSPAPNQFACIFVDVTERKQTEEKLYLQSAMLEASANAIVITNRGGSIQWANPAFTVLTGYRFPEEAFGSNPRELVKSGKQDQRFYKNLWDTILAGKVWHGELVNRRKDGSFYDEEMTITPVQNEKGKIEHFIAVKSNITERKKAEEALRESEERLRLSLQASNQGMYDLDVQTGKAVVNQEYAHMLGYDFETFIETNSAWIERLHPDDVEITSKAYADYISGLKSEYRIEFRQRTKDGNWKWILSLGRVVEWDAQGKPLRMLGTHTDITERKQSEDLIHQYTNELELRVAERTADLSRANSDLARALRARDEFLASVSHELRTPLTGILGLSEALLLNTYGELKDRQKTTLSMIEESGRHLLALINDILDLSKIEAGKLELQLAPCSLADICMTSLQLAKGMAQQKKQDVHYSPAKELVIIHADARRLKQILVNLLGNAIKFTPQNGKLGLEVQANETEQIVKLTVWDKGIGIEIENLQKLFKPFVQIDSSLAREYAGTGLGLSLVQRLTEMHNGSIEVESIIGEGSRFTVTLPWLPQNDDPVAYGSQGDEMYPATPTKGSRSPLVIIADDNEMGLQMIGDFLESQQYRAIKVRSGFELLERVTELHPDIVLVDIQMPGMDGLETIRRIRSHPNPQVASGHIIAVTALAMPGDREYCLRAGANEYFSKPIKLKELVDTIQKLLKEKA